MTAEECKELYEKMRAAAPSGHRTIRYPMDEADPKLMAKCISAITLEIANSSDSKKDITSDMFRSCYSAKIPDTDFIAALAIDGGDLNEKYCAFLSKRDADMMHNWMFELKNNADPQALDYFIIVMNRDLEESQKIIDSIDPSAAAWLNLAE